MKILDLLKDDNVFTVTLCPGNKSVLIKEHADETFFTELNYTEFCQLISELTAIAKQMLVSIHDDDPDLYTTFPD